MKLTEVLLFVFALQGAAIFFDEFYFHWRRGLPRWERVGHPLDTLTVLIPFLIAVFVPYRLGALYVFSAFAVFSSLFVTKDEFVHKELCSGAESWLHAILFVLHPLAFIVAGLLWSQNQFRTALVFQSCIVSAFLIYQIVYWSFVWPRRLRSTTTSTNNSATDGTRLKTTPSHFSGRNHV
jgi:hypothetical protein